MSSLLGASNNLDNMTNSGDGLIDAYPGPEKDGGNLASQSSYLSRMSSSSNNSLHLNLTSASDEGERNSNGLYRGSSSDIEDMGQMECTTPRKSSRSPSDSSDKVVLNGSYGGYSSVDNGSPPQSTTKTPRVVMKGYIAALKDGFGFIETMAQDGEIFFHSR